jgi:hypothetical protein
MKLKKLRKLQNSRLRWEDKRLQRPFIHTTQFLNHPIVYRILWQLQ